MTSATLRWSLTGKMPSAGDFLRRNLAAAAAAAVDDWLEAELSRRAVEHEDDWAERFAAAGRRRFRLGAEVLGAAPAHGVLAPSRDAVGRAWALIVFAPSPVATRAADTCVARALAEAASADDLLTWLGQVPAEEDDGETAPVRGSGFWASDADDAPWSRFEGLPRGEAFDRLFAPALLPPTNDPSAHA